MADDTLRFKLPVGVALSRLIEAESLFRELIAEVGRGVVGSGSVNWILVDVERGSVEFVVQARPGSQKVAPSQMPDVVNAIIGGLKTLQTTPRQPEYFSAGALEKARKLASLHARDFPIAIRNGKAAAILTKQLAANVEKIVGEPVRSIGRVEGTLERLNVHEKRTFHVFDRLTGESIECTFGNRVGIEEVAAAVERRVAVYGEITYSVTGGILGVKAEQLEVFPPAEDLPTAEDVRGILG